MSNSLQKYIRRTDKKIILATCHYDILEWLQPDWIYDLNKGGVLERGDSLRQRPQIQLQVYRTEPDTWDLFKKHHYMTIELNKACVCLVFTWDDKIVAFNSILPMPSGTMQNAFREHRLVVLPDFQGLGIGSKISEFTGAILKSQGKSYYTKTVNPALGCYRESHIASWQATPRNKQGMSEKDFSMNMMGGQTRVSYCHKYIGKATYNFEDLLKPIEKLRYEKSMEGQLCLF